VPVLALLGLRGPAGLELRPFAVAAILCLMPAVAFPFVLPKRGGAGPINAGWDRLIDPLADRYHDAIAWLLDHRGAVGALLLVWITSGAMAWRATSDDGKSAIPAAAVRIQIEGADVATLSGIARRLADTLGLLAGVERVVIPARGDYGPTPAGGWSGAIQVEPGSGAPAVLPDLARQVIGAVPIPPGFRVAMAGPRASDALIRRWLAGLAAGTSILVLVALALRERWLAPALGAGLAVPCAGAGALIGAFLVGAHFSPAGTLGATLAAALVLGHAIRAAVRFVGPARHGLGTRTASIQAVRAGLRPAVLSGAALSAALAPIGFAGGATADFAATAIGGILGGLALGLTVMAAALEGAGRSPSSRRGVA